MSSIFIIIAGILWGIISVFVTSLKSIGFSSMEVVALRVIFSAIILLIYLLVENKAKGYTSILWYRYLQYSVL